MFESMNRKIAIFGASGGARKVAQTLKNLNYFVEFFVDNNEKKWGIIFENKLICCPQSLLNISVTYNIIIASEYQKEIEKQLSEMGLLGNVILREQLIMEYIENNINEFKYLLKGENVFHSTESIIIDLVEGITLGGIENWSFMIAEEFAKQNRKILIYSKKTVEEPPAAVENLIEYFNVYMWYLIEAILFITFYLQFYRI